MRKFILALVALGLVLGATSAPAQQVHPAIITKQAKWVVWGPNGATGSESDTTMLSAVQDTTAAIYIGDYAFGANGLTVGPGAFTAMNALKITAIAEGLCDNVDSLYFRVEHSIDGKHWNQVVAAQDQNQTAGAIAGYDQGVTTLGTTTPCQIAFWAKADQDLADGAPATTAAGTAFAWSPFIRIFVRTLASDVFNNVRLYVSYPGFRQVTGR